MMTLFIRYHPGDFVVTGPDIEPVKFKSRHEAKAWCHENYPNSQINERYELQYLADEFHMMIGYCVSEWARVDDELFRIFRYCVGGPEIQCAILYYRIASLSPRIDTVDELVRSCLPKPEKKNGGHDLPEILAWKSTISGTRELLEVRNRIAHCPVTPRFGAFEAGVSSVGEALPSWFENYIGEKEQLRKGEAKTLKLEDLQTHLTEVAQFRDRLSRFFCDVLANFSERVFP